MLIPFRKMHGLGNDFVILDARAADLPLTPERIAAIGDRRRGVGFDQLIVLEPGAAGHDAFMRIANPDGSASGACGNATRCVAHLLMAESGGDQAVIRTIAGDLRAVAREGGLIEVDMGAPRLDWRDVPLARAMDTLHLPLARPGFEHAGVADPAACSMGNPHATFFVPDLAAIDAGALGPGLEHDPLFPERANIGFAEVLGPDRILLTVWERGAGLTLACGSGACAALVNAHRRGLTGREATVILPGGELRIAWRESDGHVLMTGPVATAFQGTLEL
ncbi:diaminopimelate epimerase [Roseomonas sp. OT10]|uniref:diaminopimelate epimerase n=1 Tax=Roseomonas cutis TaxID=2897332 RepID=UPI001E397BF8|nr:diaminopimelate epimerase [Roseomonas sp. OT10]UFN49946.1 diaminopimelate epimerase [Roseomonas sp. OT10]